MLVFNYRAATRTGDQVTGIVEAQNPTAAANLLADKELVVISLEESSRSVSAAEAVHHRNPFKRIKVKDVVIFTRQLAVMVSANLPLVQSLKILAGQGANPALQSVVAEVASEVEGGMKLSRALARHPKQFSDFYVNIVRSGETSGKLDEVLNYLADELEKDYDLNAKIKGAMIYPAFILSGMLIVGSLMVAFVIPQLTTIIVNAGIEVPLATRVLIFFSRAVRGYWWLMVGLVILATIAWRRYLVTPHGRAQWDYLKLHVPIFGPLLQRVYLVRFSRSLGTLLVGGVPLTSALEVVADVVGNATYKELLLQTVKAVEDGNPIASLMHGRPDVVPPMVTQMLSVGEQTGRVDAVLDRLSNFYSREIDNLVLNLGALIEPIVIVILGLGVAGMVLAVILPMYSVAQSVG